jgi:hypothetical protein
MQTQASISDRRNIKLYLLLVLAVFLNISTWLYSHTRYVKWTNVPPAPKMLSAHMSYLSDDIFGYRVWGMALQNYGNVGRAQALKDYNFAYLEDWFFLMDKLDPKSRFMPFLAAYYFSATQNPDQLPHVIKYLEMVGERPGPNNWQWMAQAIYLARHRMHDMNEALRLVHVMGSLYQPGMPLWVRNMEPMVKSDMGDRQAAYYLSLEILKSNGPKMSTSEYTSTVTMICESILSPADAAKSPICKKD